MAICIEKKVVIQGNHAVILVLDRNNAFDEVWPSLIFSVRAKGLPLVNWEKCCGQKEKSIAKWVCYYENEYRGALHVRYK